MRQKLSGILAPVSKKLLFTLTCIFNSVLFFSFLGKMILKYNIYMKDMN